MARTAGSAAARFGRALRLKRVLPWVVAATLLWFLFRKVSVAESLGALQRADLWTFLPVTVGVIGLWFLLESAAFSYLFSRFNAPLSFQEARSLRGMTYLLTPINWNLGTGAIILHLRHSKRVPALEATSSLLFYGWMDGIVLSAMAAAGVLSVPWSAPIGTIRWFACGLVAAEILLLAAFLAGKSRWRWLHSEKAPRVLRTHGMATWRDVLVLLSIRAVYLGFFIVFFWAGFSAFHVNVPLPRLAAAVPVILLVGGLPITPAGLGTQQAAMLYFFSSYGVPAHILAFGLAFPVAFVLSRLPIALLYLRDLGGLWAARRAVEPVVAESAGVAVAE